LRLVIFDFDLKSLFGSVILILIWNHFCLWSFPTLAKTRNVRPLLCYPTAVPYIMLSTSASM